MIHLDSEYITVLLFRHSYDGVVSRRNYPSAGSLVGWSTRLITGRSQVQVLPRAPNFIYYCNFNRF